MFTVSNSRPRSPERGREGRREMAGWDEGKKSSSARVKTNDCEVCPVGTKTRYGVLSVLCSIALVSIIDLLYNKVL